MREALFSQDGWGCQHVNQDTNWEVPSSPEPTNKDQSGGPPIWKPNINNGTDLWESNLRNGGQPPAQQVPKPSWGHTPSSNLGGTWGEDDDGADTSSVWTGQSTGNTAASGGTAVIGVNPASVGTSAAGPQWGQNVSGVGVNVGLGSSGNSSTTSSGPLPVVTAGFAGSVGNAGNGWGDPREIRPLGGGGPMDIRSVDPRGDAITMRGVGTGPSGGDPRDLRMIDPRDPIRGDPRGISGRLNGTSEMWGHHQPMAHNQQLQSQINKMVGSGVGAAGANVTSSNLVAGAVTSNLGGQWGSGQAVVGGPKDMSKQITGWEEPSPPPQRRNLPNYDDGTSLWGQQQARVPGGGGSGAHWKDMTETMGRSHLMRAQSSSGAGNASNVPVGGNPNNPMTGGVGPQTRLTNAIGGPSGQHGKPDATAMWGHPSNNVASRNNAAVSSWGDDGHVGNAGNNWIDDKSNTSISQMATSSSNSWNDSAGGWGKQQNKMPTSAATGWSNVNPAAGNVEGTDLNSDWPHGASLANKTQQQQQQKQLAGINVNVINTEMVKQSKQYRILVENGFKKDDVERALLSANMNIEEAAEMLRANANSSSLAMESGWRRHDDTLASYADHSNATNSGGFPPQRYPVGGTAQPSMSFPPNNLLANMSGTGVAATPNPNMAALQVQKYLSQGVGPHNVTVGGGPQSANASVAFCQQNASNAISAPATVNIASNANNQPSGQHIRMLGQQIQLAIHSGFISSQILTQPLTPTTLNLLNQLLSNIKHLQAAQQSLSRGSNANPMPVNVAIAKYKQQIQTLQNQINAQQAVYLKQQNLQQNSQQQQPQHSSGHLNNSANDYLRNHDAIATLQGNFSELNLNKQSGYQGAPNQQSRLNQWKLPVLEKDSIATDSTDFSRAPGTTKQNLSGNSNNMGALGLQNDGTWSTGRCIGDGWPDTSNDNENKDWSVASTAAAYTDLVQEFEPGKPWKVTVELNIVINNNPKQKFIFKGSQIKSIEDDPSITPGSVARSPLSINPSPKDADIFANTTGKSSPTELPPLSLSSSTWSFNPNQNFPSWSDNTQQCATSELWTSSLNKSSSRGPPPGLSTNKCGGGSVTTATTVSSSTIAGTSNGWLPNRGISNTNTTWTAANASWNSSWLLLKNLNAQIDGPTLRTLCMQHGPLVSFHQYLNQGIALCKYTTREEANKAQMALNNCVLGNTTIYAESPSDNEVQNILQHLPPQAPSLANATIASNGSGTSVNNSSVGIGSSTNSGTSSSSSSSNASNTGSNGSNNSNAASGTVVSIASVNSPAAGSVAASSATNSNSNSTISNVNSASVNGTVNNGNSSATKNTSGGSNNIATMAGGQANASTPASNNTAWRQTTPTQSQALQQGANRPPGREADYDYISQFVCSIVDD
ncbi:hypothetical protein KR093_005602 [Drosophila rubida]|uniref:UBA domain-containing protein n=1 Tax=Drosophila rubida TaxID=30044 RepID=A0AAD4K5H6_9MUSC|nr:hypothetical protein KR093_005602 [Drosophila rubida]